MINISILKDDIHLKTPIHVGGGKSSCISLYVSIVALFIY